MRFDWLVSRTCYFALIKKLHLGLPHLLLWFLDWLSAREWSMRFPKYILQRCNVLLQMTIERLVEKVRRECRQILIVLIHLGVDRRSSTSFQWNLVDVVRFHLLLQLRILERNIAQVCRQRTIGLLIRLLHYIWKSYLFLLDWRVIIKVLIVCLSVHLRLRFSFFQASIAFLMVQHLLTGLWILRSVQFVSISFDVI